MKKIITFILTIVISTILSITSVNALNIEENIYTSNKKYSISETNKNITEYYKMYINGKLYFGDVDIELLSYYNEDAEIYYINDKNEKVVTTSSDYIKEVLDGKEELIIRDPYYCSGHNAIEIGSYILRYDKTNDKGTIEYVVSEDEYYNLEELAGLTIEDVYVNNKYIVLTEITTNNDVNYHTYEIKENELVYINKLTPETLSKKVVEKYNVELTSDYYLYLEDDVFTDIPLFSYFAYDTDNREYMFTVDHKGEIIYEMKNEANIESYFRGYIEKNGTRIAIFEDYDRPNNKTTVSLLYPNGKREIKLNQEGLAYVNYDSGILTAKVIENGAYKTYVYDDSFNLLFSLDGQIDIEYLHDNYNLKLEQYYSYSYDEYIYYYTNYKNNFVTNGKYLLTQEKYNVNIKDNEIVSQSIITVSDIEKVNITGILKDNEGNPLKNVTIELHSTPRTVTTDEYGYFMFENVEEGLHTLTIKDESGKVLATKELNIINGTETKLDGDTLYFNNIDKGANLNLKISGTNLSIESIEKGTKESPKPTLLGIEVPKTFDSISKNILVLIPLLLITIILGKKISRIKFLRN